MLTPPHHHHKNTATPPHHHITTSPPTPPHHHNLAKHRIVLVLGLDASTCLLSCRLKGRDTTDQNIFVISELLMRITHRPVRDMSVIKGRDTTDQSIFGISEVLTRITTHHTPTRTSLFNIYTSQRPPNHHTTTPPQRCKTRKNASSRAGC